jgi:threonine/homoserine/homoserine lactone efflux protein
MDHPTVTRVLLFFLAFGFGFLAAIPLGGSQIEMAKRAMQGHLRAALAVVLGSVTSDILYGIIALFGIAPFMEKPWVLAGFSVVGALLLWVLSYRTYLESKKAHDIVLASPGGRSKRWAFATGFSLAFSNPPMMLTWLVGVAFAKRLGLATPFPAAAKAIFIAGGALGLGGYLSLLGIALRRAKHFIPVHAMGRIYAWLALILLLLSFFFVYGAVRFFGGL